jgi:membrane-bound lytic murein transglycosylase B
MFAARSFATGPRPHLTALLSCLVFLSPALSVSTACAAQPTTRHAKAGKHSVSAKNAKAAKSHRAGKHSAPPAPADSYARRSDAMQWAEDAASRIDLPADWVRQQIGQARRIPLIEQLVLPAPTPAAKNWAAYRSRFIEPRRIEAGAAFWQRHQTTLARAEQTYGVPASIIVGILGVETLYGQHMGNFRILDALSTLAFDFPQAHPRALERQAFFRSELEHFLRLTQRAGTDPLSIRGSFAGAMGLPQFMPSSWSHYAVDFDGDGRIDLFNSPADAIGSVANYFKAFQWKPGMPTHYPVTLTPGQTDMDVLLAPDILPTFSVESFTAKGAQLQGTALQHGGPLALIELRNGDAAPSYVAGTENFYAVTRYNWSSYYAMAVIELGQAVAERMDR